MRRATRPLPAAAVALALVATTGGLAARPAQAEEWIELFNGRDLEGWRVSENPGSVYVEDGALVTHGPRAHAFWVGAGGDDAVFDDFHFQAEVWTEPGSNSGIYFHTRYLEEGWPDRGYEAQVNNSQRDPKRTGGLYGVEDNYEAPVGDREWFAYEIRVEGRRIVLAVNGETIVDYTEPEDLDRPERQLASGLFA
ncbi:MAG: DUF1080 domain-containing protein, partial [Thermoanaerobaculia bacterium]|nr:DUF1080 domain-containing protein [Thermoanaerobaculia bacterium]